MNQIGWVTWFQTLIIKNKMGSEDGDDQENYPDGKKQEN